MENTQQINMVKQRSIHSENFTIIHNEILFIKDENNKLIDLGTLGLFWRLLSLPKAWNLNVKGLSKICGCSINKIESHLKTLKKLGYIVHYKDKDKTGKYTKNYYKINETLNSDIWKIDEMESEIIDIKNEEINNPLLTESIGNKELETDLNNSNLEKSNFEEPNFEEPNLKNQHAYKVYNNKVYNNKESKDKEYKNKKEQKTSFCSNSLKFSKIKDNINNTNGTSEKEQTNYSEPISDENQVISSENKNSILTVLDEELNNILNESMRKTELENELANQQKQINELKEKLDDEKRKNGKSIGKKKNIINHIEKSFSNQKEIMDALKSFAKMYLERRNSLTIEAFDLLIKDLYAITTNPEEMLKVINNSIKKSYLGFFPLNQNAPSTSKNNTGKSSKMTNVISQNSPPLKSSSNDLKMNDLELENNDKLELIFKPSNKTY